MINTRIRWIIFFAAKDGEALYSQQKQDCGKDHELLIAKFRLKLKKVGTTTRPFRYDLNQIPYDYTVPRCSSDSKESARNLGDLGSIPGSGRYPGEGNGNPLQYSCLENSMDREAWSAIAHGITESRS